MSHATTLAEAAPPDEHRNDAHAGGHSRDDEHSPDYMPPLSRAIPLGVQHIMAMFVGNITPPIIIAGVIGASMDERIFLIQVALFVAGICTLIQSVGVGRIGARLPIVQGTSFGFLPVALPLAKAFGLPAVLGASFIAGLIQVFLGAFLGRVRHLFSPVVTGIVVLLIGLILMPVGLRYAAGGVGAEDFAAPRHLLLALFVLTVTVVCHQFGRGFVKLASVLVGLISGYLVAIALGWVDFSRVASAAWFSVPQPLAFGMTFSPTAIIGMCIIMFVVGLETIGNISAITVSGAKRPATNRELSGGVMGDGVATSFAAVFNTLPNTAYAQNVGLVALTGVVSRHVVTIGGIFLIVLGLFPKLSAVASAMPPAVLGGAAIVMFGMIASAGVKILAESELDQRSMLILAVALSLGVGLPLVPEISQAVPDQIALLLKSGLVPAAIVALLLDAVLPRKKKRMDDAPHT
ncbi:MAG: uracil-xanthine permease family protein [Rhodocyclaceae bacterium]